MVKPNQEIPARTRRARPVGEERLLLRLYVAGVTPQSARAIESVKQLCDQHLCGRFELEIIDIYKSPSVAREKQIIAIPTLVKELPPPLRKLVGDLSSVERVLVGLDLTRHDQRESP